MWHVAKVDDILLGIILAGCLRSMWAENVPKIFRFKFLLEKNCVKAEPFYFV